MPKQLRRSLLISVLAVGIGVQVVAGSLWEAGSGSLYTAPKQARRVGDVVTILISESSSAVSEAGTQTSKRTRVGADFSDYWDQVTLATTSGDQSNRRRQQYHISGDDDFNGMGQTSRKSRIKAVVTAVITEVLTNGNFYIVGEHKIKINEETETIRVTGIIRPHDVTPQNTVFSHQIANAQVSVKGSGVVSSKQNPGLMSQLFNWVF